MDLGGLAADLEDELGGAVVDKRARVVDPADGGGGVVAGLVGVAGGDADAAFLYALEAQGDLIALAGLVEGDGVGDEALLEALKVEVADVAEQLGAVVLVADGDGVAPQEADDLGKSVGVAVGDRGGYDGWRSDEALAVETRKQVVWTGEEGAEAEGEEVGGVAGVGE